jgi:predicted DNA-binding transcriptional regulator AlpA
MLLNHEAAGAIDGLSRTQRERLIKKGLYPQPVRITTRRLGFVVDEVRRWAFERIAARDSKLPADQDPVLVATAGNPAARYGAAR